MIFGCVVFIFRDILFSPGVAKVAELDSAVRINKQVLGFDISVDQAAGVKELHATQHVVKHYFNLFLVKVLVGNSLYHLVDVNRHVLENEENAFRLLH